MCSDVRSFVVDRNFESSSTTSRRFFPRNILQTWRKFFRKFEIHFFPPDFRDFIYYRIYIDFFLFPRGSSSMFLRGSSSLFRRGSSSLFQRGSLSLFPRGSSSMFPRGSSSLFPRGSYVENFHIQDSADPAEWPSRRLLLSTHARTGIPPTNGSPLRRSDTRATPPKALPHKTLIS